jgi:hypothetical protein
VVDRLAVELVRGQKDLDRKDHKGWEVVPCF